MKPPADMGHPAHLKDGVCLSCSTDEQKTLEPAKAEDVTEITAGDLAEIRSAIEISTSELHEETIHDLKIDSSSLELTNSCISS
ncbi:unnamed protein product [Trichobilharzia regenti]|nr:unnamed protein product [Trichobilharzia regenti]